MNFYLNIEFENKLPLTKSFKKKQIKQIQKFEYFITLLIEVIDVLKKEDLYRNWVKFNSGEKVKELLSVNAFGLSKKDYKYLFKMIRDFDKYSSVNPCITNSYCICKLRDTHCICRLCDTQAYYILNLYMDRLKSSGIIIDKNKLCDELNKIWG